jgi:hypothetical protein
MGLSNSPSVFQRVMNQSFGKHLNKSVLIYLDDILIFSQTPEEHIEKLRYVFDTCRANYLSLKTNKCHFFQQELKFLGHIVSKDGIRPDPEKVQAVKDWVTPKTQSDVRSFLGLTTYFKRFIKGYAKIATPLMELTKDQYKRNMVWSSDCTKAFEELKELLTTAPVLKVPDFTKPFTLITDASQVGLGGLLLQDNQPCAYESKKLTAAECNYTTTERESCWLQCTVSVNGVYTLGTTHTTSLKLTTCLIYTSTVSHSCQPEKSGGWNCCQPFQVCGSTSQV